MGGFPGGPPLLDPASGYPTLEVTCELAGQGQVTWLYDSAGYSDTAISVEKYISSCHYSITCMFKNTDQLEVGMHGLSPTCTI